MPLFAIRNVDGSKYVVGDSGTLIDAANNDGGGTAPPVAYAENPATAPLDMASNDITNAPVLQGPPAASVAVDAQAGQTAQLSVGGTAVLTAAAGQLTAAQPLNMGANAVVTSAAPVSGSDLCRKDYVDGLLTGGSALWKASCRCVATTNTALAGLLTIDGVTLLAAESVLVAGNTTPTENGVYVAAAGAWTRRTDFDGSPTNEVQGGTAVLVTEGTTYADTAWAVSSPTGNVNVGVDNMVWVQISGQGSHNHDAVDIVSGTIDRARLPVGTTATDVAAGEHLHTGQTIESGAILGFNNPLLGSVLNGINNNILDHCQTATGTATLGYPGSTAAPVTFTISRLGNFVSCMYEVADVNLASQQPNIYFAGFPKWAFPDATTYPIGLWCPPVPAYVSGAPEIAWCYVQQQASDGIIVFIRTSGNYPNGGGVYIGTRFPGVGNTALVSWMVE